MMMKAALFLALLATVSASRPKAAEFCSEVTGENLSNAVITIKPEPVVVVEGQAMYLHVSLDLLNELEVGATAKIELIKEGLVPITLPCIDVPELGIGLGSCNYMVQDLLNLAEANGVCEEYFPGGCELPLKPGHYGGGEDTSMEIVFPAIPLILAPVVDGVVSYKLQIYQADGSEMACLSGDIELTTKV